jgi:hypothetical protein
MTHPQQQQLTRWQEQGYSVTDECPAGLRSYKGDIVCVKDNPMSRMFAVITPDGASRQIKSVWREDVN